MDKKIAFLKDLVTMGCITALLLTGFILMATDKGKTDVEVSSQIAYGSRNISTLTGGTVQLSDQGTELSSYQRMREINPDFAGWISIDGTIIDYPVMYTPEEPEKYLHLSFDGAEDKNGTPFIDASCSLSPRSDNLIVYGHHMKDGSMFGTLDYYADEVYYLKHPVISFDTAEEAGQYEVLAAFYDRVYYEDEDVFKFYHFINAEDEADFDAAIAALKEKALYDTGVEASYGDSLLMLVTCEYQEENGRFVVVAKKL